MAERLSFHDQIQGNKIKSILLIQHQNFKLMQVTLRTYQFQNQKQLNLVVEEILESLEKYQQLRIQLH